MIKQCTQCQKEFNRTLYEIKKNKSGNFFCSKTCAATYNNKAYPKRNPGKRCKCNKRIPPTGKQCQACFVLSRGPLELKTLMETIGQNKGSQRYTKIRQASRKKYLKSGKPQCCAICGYSAHFQVSHIRSISDFPLDALVSTINDPSNLIALCPNHHWEFDHGLIQLGLLGFEPRIFRL